MNFGGKTNFKKGGNWKEQRTIVPPENRTSTDGIIHRTRAECKRWDQLRLLEQAGHVRNLRREVKYKLELIITSGHCDGIIDDYSIKSLKGNVRSYTADFVYETRSKDLDPKFRRFILCDEAPYLTSPGAWWEVIEDIKGFLEPVQELRMDIFAAFYGVRVFINKV